MKKRVFIVFILISVAHMSLTAQDRISIVGADKLNEAWYEEIIDATLNHSEKCRWGFICCPALSAEYAIFYNEKSQSLELFYFDFNVWHQVFKRFSVLSYQPTDSISKTDVVKISLNDSVYNLSYVIESLDLVPDTAVLSISSSVAKQVDKTLTTLIEEQIKGIKDKREVLISDENRTIYYFGADRDRLLYSDCYISEGDHQDDIKNILKAVKESILSNQVDSIIDILSKYE